MSKLICLLCFATLILTSYFNNNFQKKENKKKNNCVKWQKHQIENLTQYEVHGTFTYFFNHYKVYTRFIWKQTKQDNYCLLLLNPLGFTVFKINVQLGGYSEFFTAKKRYHTSSNVEETIFKITGIQIPLKKLCYWIIGSPGDATDYKLDKQCHLRELNYNWNGKNWKVLYGDYNKKITPALPSYIELIESRHCIRLKINNWILKSK